MADYSMDSDKAGRLARDPGTTGFQEGIGREPNVLSQLNRLEKQAHMLGEAIERTAVRFSPILRPDDPAMAADKDTDVRPPMSDIAVSLERVNRQLQRHFDDLNSIIERGEV